MLGAGAWGPTLLFSCCSSIWMSVSLARSSSLAACSAARASALSPLARLPALFFDMVRLDGQTDTQGQMLRLGWGVHTKLLAGVALAVALLHFLTHLEGKHT